MDPAAERLLTALRHRVWTAAFSTAVTDAVVVGALALTVVLVVARISGHDLRPGLAWLALCALPIGWGIWRSLGSAPGRQRAAAWLDRRMGLGGLLMTSTELPADAWRATLASHLASTAPALPRVDVPALLRRALPALVALAVALLLEAPPVAPLAKNPMLAHALEDLRDKVERAGKEGALAPEEKKELAERLAKLEQAKEAGQAIEWADVDTLTQHVERALERRQQELRRGVAGLDRAAEEQGAKGSKENAAGAELAKALRQARAAGLLRDLPKELRDKLEKALDGEGKPGDPAATPEQMQALAKELQEHLAEKLKALAELGVKLPSELDPSALPAEGECDLLAEGLEGLAPDSRPCSAAAGGAGQKQGETSGKQPGRGGITRGGGSAPLELAQDTDLTTKGMRAERLPEGKVPPKSWSGTLLREAPEVDPQRSGEPGGQGQAGAGAASWRRRLSPEHREAVKRYFGGERR